MSVIKLAAKYRLHARRDVDGTTIIPGRFGHIYEYSADELGVIFIPTGKPRPRKWKNYRHLCLEAGMTLRQNGDAEGAFSFDSDNPEHVDLAIRMAGIRRKKLVSGEYQEELAKRLSAANEKLKKVRTGR